MSAEPPPTTFSPPPIASADASPTSVTTTDCCVVGAGPAGAVLAYLLARAGRRVVLLEAAHDLDRDFRGDTIHPSAMALMDELGLAERLLALPHAKLRRAAIDTPRGPFVVADFGRLRTRFPYITMMPQAEFLAFLTAEAARFPGFEMRLGAPVQALVVEGGAVRGVRYRGRDGWHEVRAEVTVGADGRSSRVRDLAGIPLAPNTPPMDVLWFKLPRRPGDPGGFGALGRFGAGRILIMLERADGLQCGLVFPKGGYHDLHAAGIDALRRSVAELEPLLADRVDALTAWRDVSLLTVEAGRVATWHRPGLLLIGDAAHVMTPVGGVGINYAIQDAVEAANALAPALAAGMVTDADLARVQARREWPTRVIQAIQRTMQEQVLRRVLAMSGRQPLDVPWPVRLLVRVPILRDIPARVIAFGVRGSHVSPALRSMLT